MYLDFIYLISLLATVPLALAAPQARPTGSAGVAASTNTSPKATLSVGWNTTSHASQNTTLGVVSSTNTNPTAASGVGWNRPRHGSPWVLI